MEEAINTILRDYTKVKCCAKEHLIDLAVDPLARNMLDPNNRYGLFTPTDIAELIQKVKPDVQKLPDAKRPEALIEQLEQEASGRQESIVVMFDSEKLKKILEGLAK